MKEHYTYDELYGTLLHKNKDDTERTYFIIECLKHRFYRWMFIYGWDKVQEKKCERNGLQGFEITYTNRLEDTMIVVKRDCSEVEFNKNKIINAILKAMKYGSGIVKEKIAEDIANEIEEEFKDQDEISIYDIENMVFDKLITKKQRLTAKAYESYKVMREYQRATNTIDNKVLGLIDGTNKTMLNENSNKNDKLISTQRDLVAEEVSKDIALRMMLPAHIAQAHNEGIIHVHDLGHYLNPSFNCCLVNLIDMLDNGTVINGKMIESPHRFQTACTIATQIIAQVASGQFGGQTISIAHLSPYVRKSKMRIERQVRERLGKVLSEDQIINETNERLKEEIQAGIQTFNYQINTLQTSNGQSPFLSVFMYINEYPEYEEETAVLIEEMLNQRILGMKNEVGVYITPAFPKLLYVTDENNIHRESKYFYLTELAAKCIAKRMMPDLISAKHMRLNYEGNIFGCMGCVDGQEIITYKFNNKLFVESFWRMWNRLSDYFIPKEQIIGCDKHLYLEVDNVTIYDTEKGFVKVKKVIRNTSSDWLNVKMSHGRSLLCTTDHPFHTSNRGRVNAKDLNVKDIVQINPSQYYEENLVFDTDKAWLLGFILCDGCYDGHISSSIALESEDDIEEKYKYAMKKYFNLGTETVIRHRGAKGNYKDLNAFGDNITKTIDYLSVKFEGLQKNRRHIPNEVFEWDYNSKLAFLAGMIDADGYINPTSHGGSIVQLGSTNKELALQQMALAQSLGIPVAMYQNHYTKKNPNAIRYRIEFAPSDDLLTFIISQKKIDNYVDNITNYTHYQSEINSVVPVENITMFSYDVETESDHFEVSGIYSYNCRAWLSPYKGNINNKDNTYKWYGRLNMGLTSINLSDVGLSANGDIDTFWQIFNDRLDLCKESLLLRYDKLKDITSDVSPIHWQHGAIARLPKHEPIYPLLQDGYATITLGYIGIYECVKALIGKSHTTPEGEKLALEIMRHMKQKIAEWKKETGLGFALYGTPSESLTEKFAHACQKRHGIIEGITDRNYLTNSYHVFVKEEIDPFNKLMFESQFHPISSGGCISYIEMANMTNNIPVIIQMMQFMYDNIQYAEYNTKSDYCHVCGFDGEILIDDNLDWYCPNCGNRDKSKMNVVRRTCGYLGENFWNEGRTEEIKERYVHLDNHDYREGDCN